MAETIGLDIGSHSMKLVGLKKGSKGFFLTHLGWKRIPHGMDKEDIGSLSTLLRDLIAETNIKTKKVKLTVSGVGIQLRRLTMPAIPHQELMKALPWEMKDHLPYPVETARIQYHLLGKFIEDGAKKLDLLVAACPNALIERTLSIAEKAGLQVIHLDIGAFALWNMLLMTGHLNIGQTTALIDLGSEKMGLYLFKEDVLQFSREMTPAGEDLTRAVIDVLPFEKDLNFLFERAEKIKEQVGIYSGVQDLAGLDEKFDVSKISFLMRPVLERWVAEIGRSIDYYQHQFYGEKIDRILLTGGGAHLKNVVSYFEKELRLPVEIFNPVKAIPFDLKVIEAGLIEEMGSVFTTAAGVALSEPKQIEFLTGKESFWDKMLAERFILIIAPLLILFLFLGIIWYKTGQVTALQKERNEKVSRVAGLEKLKARLAMVKEKETKMKQDLSLFPSSVTPPIPYRKVLREVNGIIPANVTLRHLEIQAGEPSSTTPPKTSKPQGEESKKERLYLSALAFGKDVHCLTAIAQMIEGLEKSFLFSHVKLISTDENKQFNQSAVEFEILCDIDLDPSSKEKL